MKAAENSSAPRSIWCFTAPWRMDVGYGLIHMCIGQQISKWLTNVGYQAGIKRKQDLQTTTPNLYFNYCSRNRSLLISLSFLWIIHFLAKTIFYFKSLIFPNVLCFSWLYSAFFTSFWQSQLSKQSLWNTCIIAVCLRKMYQGHCISSLSINSSGSLAKKNIGGLHHNVFQHY